MNNYWDTIAQVRRACYTLQAMSFSVTGSTPGIETAELPNTWSLSFDSILYYYSRDWGGVCGNYATFFRKALELYGIRAWEFSMGTQSTSSAGHMITLVEQVRSVDTGFYLIDANYNTHLIDSAGNPVDIRDQIAYVAQHRQRELNYADNQLVGPYFSREPCNLVNEHRIWTPETFMENPQLGCNLFRGYYLRRIKTLATQVDYQIISDSYQTLENQGFDYQGNPKDFPMSVLWFRGLYGSVNMASIEMQSRIYGWLHNQIVF
jgi:hypothetical protein